MKRHESSRILKAAGSLREKVNNTRKHEITKCGLLIRVVGTTFTFGGGGLIAYRALQDGTLSFYGVLLRLFSFFILGTAFAFDTRMEISERALYVLPKIGAIILTMVQLVGIWNTRDDALSSI